jgi:hypothetical protein
MKIRLKRTWFAPDISGSTGKKYVGRNGRVLARGHRLRAGVHDVPSEWQKALPSDAVVLEGGYTLEEDETEFPAVQGGANPVHDVRLDTTQHQSVATLANVTQEAESRRAAEIKARRQANLAKAREAKQLKKENKTNA